MGLLKKISKSLTGKSSSKEKKKGKDEDSRANPQAVGQSQKRYGGATHGAQNGRSEASASPFSKPKLHNESKESSSSAAGSVALKHVRHQQPQAPSEVRESQGGDKYINGSSFRSFDEVKQDRASSAQELPAKSNANIKEAPLSTRKKTKSGFDKVFQRPKPGQGGKPPRQAESLGKQPTSSIVQPPLVTTESNPAVTLTVILDPSLATANGSSPNIMRDIALGVLNLMRALAPTDTISIFG